MTAGIALYRMRSFRPNMLFTAAIPSRVATWANMRRPVTSPQAQMPGDVGLAAVEARIPLALKSTPASSRPRPATLGARPAALRMQSAGVGALRTVGLRIVQGAPVDPGDFRRKVELDALALEDLQQPACDIAVASGGDVGQHLIDRNLDADFVEETGEFQADVAAAHDGHAAGIAVNPKTVSESSTRAEPIPVTGGTAGRDPVAIRILAAS